LIDEFDETRPAEVICGCADRMLDFYDGVPVRTHDVTLAHKRTRECLREDTCALLLDRRLQ
jgi:hypothetical protein